MQNQKSKIQNQTSKINPPKTNETVRRKHYYYFGFIIFSVSFIGFPITSQNAKKKSARVPPRPIGQKKSETLGFAGNVFFFLFGCSFSQVFFCFFISGGGQIEPGSRDSQGLISRPQIKKNKFTSAASKISK